MKERAPGGPLKKKGKRGGLKIGLDPVWNGEGTGGPLNR